MVNIVDHYQVGDVGMIDDVDIDAASIGSAAADIEIPLLSSIADDRAHDAVAEEIESRQEDERCCDGDEYFREHVIRRSCRVQ